jgi:hypothetical protein
VHAATPAPGTAEILAADRCGDAETSRRALDRRQLRRSEARQEQTWLKRHERFHLQFTLTSASWINQVERLFGLITEDRIRCRVFKSFAQQEADISEYLNHCDAGPEPFVWTASATTILAKVARRRHAGG